jgi:isoleucyl-tRNA synthetase
MSDSHIWKKSQFASIEEEILAKWQKEDTFKKSIKNREGGEFYSFYDGPPFANGLPHFGHSLASSIKDSILRYKTMRGYYVPRRNGWDCHGLPVEYAIEKEFGVSGKKQILELGLEKFNAACRDSIFKYKADWEDLLQRLGRWSEYENYYATVDSTYTESVWWVLSEINKKGLLYKGYKSSPYCPRCETPLSNFEVNEGYRDNVPDPSLFVKFKLKDEDASLLGWTTTPWSLPGNAAIAVSPDEDYVYAAVSNEEGDEVLIMAEKRLEALDAPYKVQKKLKGHELVGKRYKPLFKLDDINEKEGSDKLYQVWPAEFVSTDDGSGVLHVAPAFGEDDLRLGQENGLPVLSTVDTSGKLIGGIGFDDVEGKFFKGADRPIIEHLTKQGAVYAAGTAEHTYPFCWRCDTPLLYYAITSWFVKVSDIREDLLKTAEKINWVPANIKQGRFGKWLEGARDWAISRNRYWGAPMPIWVNVDDPDDYIVVSSFEELKSLAGDDIKLDDVHRPFIDDISFSKDGKTYKRVEEVLDCWFESGSMSVAQQHYPFENKDRFDQTFPADFIIEGLDQTRLWFYVQHVVATILFDQPAFTNVVVNGIIMAADGQKLSKRLKNYPPVEEVFNTEGADSLRLYLLSSTQATEVADYMRFNRDAMKDMQRNVLGTLMNSYRFFKMYADIDEWKPANFDRPTSENILDKWILDRLDEATAEATASADQYKIAHTLEPIFLLVDDLSNWYIRRSRRRFWKSEDDNDKQDAYATLWYVLMRVSQLLAPWAPFITDYFWRELSAGGDLPESVHLSDWPSVSKPDKASLMALDDMKIVRELIAKGLAKRAEAKVKVRQPLNSVAIPSELKEYENIIKEELNVKEVILVKDLHADQIVQLDLDVQVTPELKAEGLARDLIRVVQNARKNAGFNVDDRIKLRLSSDSSEVMQATEKFKDLINTETLAVEDLKEDPEHSETVKVEGQEVTIALKRS